METILAWAITLSLMFNGGAYTTSMTEGKNVIAAECVIIETADSPLEYTGSDNPCYANEDEVFRTYDELQKYIDMVEKCDSTEKIINQLKNYDESFFEENVLFYGYDHGTGNVEHKFDAAVIADGSDGKPCVEVYVNTDWSQCIDSGASYSYFVKLAKSDVEAVEDDNFLIVTYSDTDENI